MRTLTTDPKKVPGILKELGFKVGQKRRRATVYEKEGVKVVLPHIFRDWRGLENWFHSNKAKLEGSDGKRV